MAHHLQRLYQHLQWADVRILTFLEQIPEPPADVMRLFGHLLTAEQIWLSRIRASGVAPTDAWPSISLAECRALSSAAHADFHRMISSLSVEESSAVVIYRNLKGTEFHTSLSDILLHVAIHGAYHRGQIATKLKLDGYEPMNTDFIAFARE